MQLKKEILSLADLKESHEKLKVWYKVSGIQFDNK